MIAQNDGLDSRVYGCCVDCWHVLNGILQPFLLTSGSLAVMLKLCAFLSGAIPAGKSICAVRDLRDV